MIYHTHDRSDLMHQLHDEQYKICQSNMNEPIGDLLLYLQIEHDLSIVKLSLSLINHLGMSLVFGTIEDDLTLTDDSLHDINF
jgi:hypothetical protein